MNEALQMVGVAELFPAEVVSRLETEGLLAKAASGKFDLSRTEARIVEAVASLRGQGMSIRDVCSTLKVSPHTVLEVESQHPQLVATQKERLVRRMRAVSGLAVERAADALVSGAMKPAEMGVTAGIFAQRASDMEQSGMPAVSVVVSVDANDYARRAAEIAESAGKALADRCKSLNINGCDVLATLAATSGPVVDVVADESGTVRGGGGGSSAQGGDVEARDTAGATFGTKDL